MTKISFDISERASAILSLASLTCLSAAFPGCTAWRDVASMFSDSPGSIESMSLDNEPVLLQGEFTHGYYTINPSGSSSLVLADAPLEQWKRGEVRDGQALHVQLLWQPKPGSTPLDESATNISISHVIVSSGEIGVYAGGGFAIPRGEPGDDRLSLALRDASIELSDSTDGFVDLLSPARMTGSVTATLDDSAALALRYAISQLVTDALGRSRMVLLDDEANGATSALASRLPHCPCFVDQPLIESILTRR
jgi:hypothetical protein